MLSNAAARRLAGRGTPASAAQAAGELDRYFATRPNLETYIVGVFDCFQIPYSALERQHEELIQAAVDFGAGVIVRGAVAREVNWCNQNVTS